MREDYDGQFRSEIELVMSSIADRTVVANVAMCHNRKWPQPRHRQ